MIQVKKGDSLLTVTKGAYDSYYRRLGYEPVGVAESNENSDQGYTQPPEETKPSEEGAQQKSAVNALDGATDGADDTAENPEHSSDEVDLSEIPLGELSHSQLFEYADQLGLEYEGTMSKKELRALIKEHLGM